MILDRICEEVDLMYLPGNPEKLCRLPYPGHPKGCPNAGKRVSCPPEAPMLSPGRYLLVAVQFDLAAWAARMKEKHPAWSDRQARCCLYWQGQVRRELREYVWHIGPYRSADSPVEYIPEAGGANIDLMMKTLGHPLQWRPPIDFVWKVALILKEVAEPCPRK